MNYRQDYVFHKFYHTANIQTLVQDLYNEHKDDAFRSYTVNEIEIYRQDQVLVGDDDVPNVRLTIKRMYYNEKCHR